MGHRNSRIKRKDNVPSLHKSTLSDTRQKDNICKDDYPCSDNVPYVNLAENVRFNLPQMPSGLTYCLL